MENKNIKMPIYEPKRYFNWRLCGCDCPVCSCGYAHCKCESSGCFVRSTEEKFNEYLKKPDKKEKLKEKE
jgi:hypothetical protein